MSHMLYMVIWTGRALPGFTIDHHLEAGVIIFGMVLDVLGALYLAYDVLGGREGPLRTLTKFITYGLAGMLIGILGFVTVFSIVTMFHLRVLDALGYTGTLGVGLGYAILGGFTSGVAYMVGVGLRRRKLKSGHLTDRQNRLRIASAALVGILAGLSYGIASWTTMVPGMHRYVQSLPHAVFLGSLLGIFSGLVFGISGGRLLQKVNVNLIEEPHVDRLGILIGIVLGLAVAPVSALSYWLVFGADLMGPLITSGIVGIIGGVGCGVALATAPIIEYRVYNLPDRRLGVTGTGLILAGFVIQSLQYWINLLDIPVR